MCSTFQLAGWERATRQWSPRGHQISDPPSKSWRVRLKNRARSRSSASSRFTFLKNKSTCCVRQGRAIEPGKIKMTPRSHIFQNGALCLASLRCVSQKELDPSAWICCLSKNPGEICVAVGWTMPILQRTLLGCCVCFQSRLATGLVSPKQTIVIAHTHTHTHTPAETTQHKLSRSLSSEPACLARESQLQRRFSHLWLPRKREILILVNASL